MIDHAIETWAVAKPAVASAGGVVASQHHAASDAGASVLTAGGNAVDAAIAASFVIGVVEPWMSGLGGGGCMLVYRARDRTAHAIDFNVAACGVTVWAVVVTVNKITVTISSTMMYTGIQTLGITGGTARLALARLLSQSPTNPDMPNAAQ